MFNLELMINHLKNLWDLDFSAFNVRNLFLIWIFAGGFLVYKSLGEDQVFNYFELFTAFFAQHPQFQTYTFIMYVVAGLLIVYVVAFVILTDIKSSEEIGRKKFYGIVMPHLLVNFLDVALVGLMVFAIEFFVRQFVGAEISVISLTTLEPEFNPFKGLINWYNTHIPIVVKLPYLLAIFVTLILADLPIYILHYATHWSRFLWFTVHRSHHTPEYLHLGGTGPVFGFGVFIILPYFFIKLGVSKLIYTEPLILELLVIQIVYFVTEKFNHASVYYDVAYKNKFIYNIFRFFGNGPYHYTHHSAREGEDVVNLANMGFNFWDRIFGTFKEPSKERPPVGLTRQPKIKMNPFRLYLSGFFTIGYELKHNHFKHWFRILFGSVYYTPPKSKDYLIEYYPEETVGNFLDTNQIST